jgi:uncharacterized protein DUF5086
MRLSNAVAIAALIAMVAFSTVLSAGSASEFTEESIWMLPDTETDLRWLEIHEIEGVGTQARLYHISVLGRRKADPVWNLKHIVAHMAITDAALSRSVARAASRMRAAYPETYEEAHRAWLTLREKGNAPICGTTVMECAGQ